MNGTVSPWTIAAITTAVFGLLGTLALTNTNAFVEVFKAPALRYVLPVLLGGLALYNLLVIFGYNGPHWWADLGWLAGEWFAGLTLAMIGLVAHIGREAYRDARRENALGRARTRV
ncbi:hypothetical protein HJC99_06880 [Candidatus Saccharibacteria bacterium]|nr:hypothetical protein [Candidatus Saccharibacteria bacterium]